MAIHASHSGLPYPVRNARYTLPLFWLDADGDPTDPVPDTEVSLDGAAFGDCAEEVVPIAGSGSGLLTLSALETNASLVMVAAKSTSGNAKNTLAALNPRVLPILESGTAQAGAAGSITLAITAPAYSLVGTIIRTTGGTGGGGANNQARVVTAYNGTTKVATVVPNWEVNPAGPTPGPATTYDILITDMASNAPVANVATLAAAAITAIQANLATSAGLTTGVNSVLGRLPTALAAGGQMKAHVEVMSPGTVTAAVIATGAIDDDALDPTAVDEITAGFTTTQDMVDAIWNELKADHITPNSFGDFLDIEVSSRASTAGGGGLDAAQTAAAVWGALRASYANPNTFGERVNADVTAISADAAAADALETMLDGTGGSVLSLRQLNIVNASGSAIVASSTGGNGNGIAASGNGTGAGVAMTGGGSAGSAGMMAIGANHGIVGQAGGGSGAGLFLLGSGSGSGLQASGGNNGSGLVAQGGVGAGADGARFVAGTGSNGDGLELVKNGAGLPMNPAASGGGGATAAEIADAVWAEDLTVGYTTEGTAGKELKDASAGAGLTAAQVTAAVWDVTKGVRPANSFGESVNLNAAGLATNAIDADALNPDVATELNAPVLAVVAAVQADTDNIQTRLPASLVAGRMDSSVGAMAADTITASAVATGAIDPTALAAGAIHATAMAAGSITPAVIATDAIDGDALATTALTEIENAVWNALKANHVTPDTFGDYLDDEISAAVAAGTSGNLTALQVEDAVWNAARSAHVGATSFGGGVLLAANAVTAAAIANDAITAAKLDATVGPEIAVSVWANATRSLTTFGTLVTDIWAAATRTITGLTDPAVDNIWNRLRAAVTRPAGSFGNYVDAAISGVSTGGVSVNDIANAVWNEPRTGGPNGNHTTSGTFGSYVDASISGVSTGGVSAGDIADAVWAEPLATYTAGQAGKLVTDTAAAVDTEVAAIKAKTDLIPASPAAIGSPMTLAAGAIGSATFALNAITGNALDPTAGAEIADAVWDEQLSGHPVSGSGGASLAGSFAAVDTEVAAIKAKTDLITGAPATVGAPMTLAAGAVNATSVADDAIDGPALASSAITKIQNGLATDTSVATVQGYVDELETRLTPARAGYLDNLDPAPPTAAEIDAALGATHGAGSWVDSGGAAPGDIAEAVWAEPLPGAYTGDQAGSVAGSLLARLGGWAGTGTNTVLGAFRALAGRLAGITPTDLTAGGVAFNNATDSLEAIRDRGDTAWVTGAGGGGNGGGGGLGAGAWPVTVRVQDEDLAAVHNAVITVYADPLAGNPLAGPWPTNGNGQVTFNLDDAVYNFVVRTDPGYSPAPVQNYEVAGLPLEPAVTFNLESFAAGAAGEAGLCRVYGWLRLGNGIPVANSEISFQPVGPPPVTDTPVVIATFRKIIAPTDADGYFYADLQYSTEIGNWKVACKDANLAGDILTVPSTATALLADLL